MAIEAAIRRNRAPLAERIFLRLLLAIVVLLVVPPLAILVFGSLTDTPPAVAPHFTFATIALAFGEDTIYRSLLNSVIYAASTATIVLIVGGALAWLVARTDSAVRHFADLFALAPILIPEVLQVSGWILLLGPRNGLINLLATQYLGFKTPLFNIFTMQGMILVGVLQELPLAFLWLWPAFQSMNPDLEEAGRMSGAGTFAVLRRITLPVLKPTILSAWIIFFITAFGSLSVPLLLGLPSRTFLYSTEIYLAAHRTPTNLNLASAYALLFVALTIVGLYAYRRGTVDAARFVTVTGRAFAPRPIRLGRYRLPVTIATIILLLCMSGLPFLVLVWNAFMPYPQAPSLKSLELATLVHFGEAYRYGPAVRAVVNSALLGLAAGVIATLLGFVVAWCSLRLKSQARMIALLDQIATIPLAIPGMVAGVGLLWLYLVLPIPIYGTPWILLIAYVTLLLPYAARICHAGLVQIHSELEEAASLSGAGRFRTIFRIVLRLAAPSATASILYVALRAFREYSASIFLTAPGTEVFSVEVLDMWEGGSSNILSAYVTMVMGVLALVIGVVAWAGRVGGLKFGREVRR